MPTHLSNKMSGAESAHVAASMRVVLPPASAALTLAPAARSLMTAAVLLQLQACISGVAPSLSGWSSEAPPSSRASIVSACPSPAGSGIPAHNQARRRKFWFNLKSPLKPAE